MHTVDWSILSSKDNKSVFRTSKPGIFNYKLHNINCFNKVCISKYVYFQRIRAFVNVYRFACAHFNMNETLVKMSAIWVATSSIVQRFWQVSWVLLIQHYGTSIMSQPCSHRVQTSGPTMPMIKNDKTVKNTNDNISIPANIQAINIK